MAQGIPRENDVFSGKTVATKDMASKMVSMREGNAPKVGDQAPSFNLLSADGLSRYTLSQLHADKPVVLIMSSWGCDIFRESLAGIQAMYSAHSNNVNFAMVYIREAHPYDGFAGFLGRTNDARTVGERVKTARRCKDQLRLPFPVLVDSMDDRVTTRWAAWPVRVFVIGKDGRVIYAGAQGPWSYRPYEGFLHGDGIARGLDHLYSQESLERFLNRNYPVRKIPVSQVYLGQ